MSTLSCTHHSGHALFSLYPQCYPSGKIVLLHKNWKKHTGVSSLRSSANKGAGEGLFVKPLDVLYPQIPCRICKGRGRVACDKCDGKGSLGRGGYQKKNPVDLNRIIGSKWTALETTFGWRHFIVHTKQRGSAKDWFLEMVATCDKNTHFWINSKNLKDRGRWSMGWLQRDELMHSNEETKEVALCKACKGEGRLTCRACLAQNGSTTNNVDIVEV